MASVVRLAVGTLSAVAHQAATFCSTPLRLLSIPCLATAHSSRQGIATSSTRHASVMARSSSLLSAVSSTSLSTAPTRTVLQNVQRVCVPINMQSCRSYHVRVALKKRCSSCYFVRRKGRLYMECKAKPRHKQMQVMSKRKTWKEDYSEGNIKGAMYWKYHRDHGYYRLGNTPFVRHDWLKGKIGVTV